MDIKRFILALVVCLTALKSVAATLYITNYGAIGDYNTNNYVNATSNSAVIHTTNTFTAADIGKAFQLYSGGTYAQLGYIAYGTTNILAAPSATNLYATTVYANGSSVLAPTFTRTYTGLTNGQLFDCLAITNPGANLIPDFYDFEYVSVSGGTITLQTLLYYSTNNGVTLLGGGWDSLDRAITADGTTNLVGFYTKPAYSDAPMVFTRLPTDTNTILYRFFQVVAIGSTPTVKIHGGTNTPSYIVTGQFNTSYGGGPTNHQDLAGYITGVDGTGTNVTLSVNCGNTSNNLWFCYGTENRTNIQFCIDAAQSNDVIRVTTGNFLCMDSNALNPNYVQTFQYSGTAALTINKGGLKLLGDGTNVSIITGAGAWQQKGFDQAYRGALITMPHTGSAFPTNNGPLVFEGIQFNGGAVPAAHNYVSYPADPANGQGWDPTHHGATDIHSPQGLAYWLVTNCLFAHWHGELLQGISDGYSSVINFNKHHNFLHNVVIDTHEGAEDGQFLDGSGTNLIMFNYFTNIWGSTTWGVGGAGAVPGTIPPSYLIASNRVVNGGAFSTAGAMNISYIGNSFDGCYMAIGAAGSFGGFQNSNIFIGFNTWSNVQVAIFNGSSYANRAEAVTIISNRAFNISEAFTEIVGYLTNVNLYANASDNHVGLGFPGADLGQWFYDDLLSNAFPPKTDSTSTISYVDGARHVYAGSSAPTAVVSAAQTPAGATMVWTNDVTSGQLWWNQYTGAWQTNAVIPDVVVSDAFRGRARM